MTAPRSTAEYEYHAVPVEDVVYEFEKAFRAGTGPSLETFLVGDGPDRWQLLVELAHSELELRLRAGQPARLSDYLERFPGLAHFPNELAALLVTEVKLRTQAGDGPDLKEYEARYAVLGPRVREAFRKIGAAPPEVPGYDVLDRIAAGGMGVVYRARQLLLQREVALKVIRRDRLAGGEAGDRFRARFRREAQAVAAVNHPNVVQVYETGESDGDLFIAMELVNGPSLQAKLDTAGVLAPAAAAALVEAVARAVDAVHARGIVHRDLKPDNVLVAADGTPKVADFGLARPAEVADGKTKAGVFVGTPEYSSPEQAALTGEDPTPRTDVYGLGAVLYAALTGRPPFPRADLLTTLDRVRTQPVASVRTLRPDVPRDLETVCLKCLGKEPHRRYASAAALAADLRRFLAGEPVLARPVGRAERAWKWARRNPVVAGLLVAVVASLVGGTVASTVFAVRADENAGRATEKAELARLEAEEKERQRAQADFQRGEAVKEFQRAERERLRVRAALFNTQLLRVQAVCESDPTLATDLLNDPLACPPEEQDFTWALYARASRRDLGTLDGQGVVTAVAYSPTGKTLAVASLDGKVRLWDTRTKTVRSTLTGQAGGVLRVAYSPDGRTLATGGNDRTIRLWDARTGEEVAVLGRHGDRVSGVAFSPDGSTLATAGWDGLVKFWDVEARTLAATLRGHTGWVMCVAFSPDGTTLATGGREGEAGVVKLWDVEAKKEVATLNGHKAFVQAVAFSPDGRTVASGGDFTVRLWDVRTRSERAVLDGHGSFVAGVAFSPDGATVASTAMDETVRLWDARSGRPTGVLRGHARLPTAVGFSPDGATLATGDGNLGGGAGSVKLWAVRPPWEKARFRVHDDSVFAVAFHPNGKTVASAGHGHRRLFAPATTFEVWDAATGSVRPEFQGRGRHADAVAGLCYGPDGATLATASWDGTVKTWDAGTGAPGATCRGHAGWVYAVCFTPDGKTIVSGGQDGTVRLWDAATGAQLRCIATGSGAHAVDVSPDGTTIAAACDTEIKLFDVATGEPRGVLAGHTEAVNAVCFSPDGATLASAAGGPGKAEKPDHTVRLWDVATLKERAVLKGHGLRARCVCFSPDGKTLASGDGDLVGRAAVIVWDARSGQQRATLPCDADAVLAVAFSPDSRTLAAGRSDGAVALY